MLSCLGAGTEGRGHRRAAVAPRLQQDGHESALFEGTEDTVYTSASLDGNPEGNILPEGFENVVIEGYGNTGVTGNTQDNIITGNVGNNVIDGGDGNDTFVTQGNFDTSSSIYNLDGSVTLNSEGGTDELINIEFVKFDDGIKTINDVIGPLAPTLIVLDAILHTLPLT